MSTDKQYSESIYFSYIKGKYNVGYDQAMRDIENICESYSDEHKEPDRDAIAKKLQEMYKDREVQ